jgi:acetyltransferase-like isoleucine patch superfamily enzyme
MKLIIFGTSDIARCAFEYFTKDSLFEVVAFTIDSSHIKDQEKFLGLPLIPFEEVQTFFSNKDHYAFVAVGSQQLNRLRSEKYEQFKKKGFNIASYVSSKAFVWDNVFIGENCFILENNVIQPYSEIGNNVTLWSGNHIGHSSIIQDHVFISSHVVVSGFCDIGEYSFLGVNVSVGDTIKIGKDNYISMGTAVTKSTSDNFLIAPPKFEISKVSAKRFCRVKE